MVTIGQGTYWHGSRVYTKTRHSVAVTCPTESMHNMCTPPELEPQLRVKGRMRDVLYSQACKCCLKLTVYSNQHHENKLQ